MNAIISEKQAVLVMKTLLETGVAFPRCHVLVLGGSFDFWLLNVDANSWESGKESGLSRGNCMFYSKCKNKSTNSGEKGVDLAE